MIKPTDEQIFNHMMPDDNPDYCEKCDGEIRGIECDHCITYECLICGYSPEPEEEIWQQASKLKS